MTINTNYLHYIAKVKSIYYQHIYKKPFVVTDKLGLQYFRYPTDNIYDYFMNSGYNENKEMLLVSKIVGLNDIAIDIGANIGVYTLQFSSLVGQFGKVIAIEPEKYNYQRLQENLVLNSLKNVVSLNQLVYSQKTRMKLNVYQAEQYGWHTLGSPMIYYHGKPALPISHSNIEATTIDHLFKFYKLPKVRLIKIDVEGAELDVLKGAQNALKQGKIQFILYEVSPIMVQGMGHKPNQILSLLSQYGYVTHGITNNGIIGKKIKRFSTGYDNYIAFKNYD